MCKDTTILYLTDNILDERLAEVCKKHLLKAADGKRIVSVSQKPIDFGDNICVGDIGREGININKQARAGLEHINTKYVAVAEHDCIYDKEHFNFIPEDDRYFYFNSNCWIMQYYNKKHPEYNGMFSYKLRHLHSQMITGRDNMLEMENEHIEILSDRENNRKRWLRARKRVLHTYADWFCTKIPNIDVRHDNNFTGSRRGKKRRWELKPWGTMEDILNV